MANLRPLDMPTTAPSASTLQNSNLSFYNNTNANVADPNLSDDEPIYDPVADDDYEAMPAIAQQVNFMRQQILTLNNSFS